MSLLALPPQYIGMVSGVFIGKGYQKLYKILAICCHINFRDCELVINRCTQGNFWYFNNNFAIVILHALIQLLVVKM